MALSQTIFSRIGGGAAMNKDDMAELQECLHTSKEIIKHMIVTGAWLEVDRYKQAVRVYEYISSAYADVQGHLSLLPIEGDQRAVAEVRVAAALLRNLADEGGARAHK